MLKVLAEVKTNKLLNTVMQSKGFTLIELIVVIAIIGILASIVMSELQNARKSARDAVLKSMVSEAAKVAELYYDDFGTYEFVCNLPTFQNDGTIGKQIVNNGGTLVCGDAAGGYCISSTLNLGPSLCVDHWREVKSGLVCTDADDIECE